MVLGALMIAFGLTTSELGAQGLILGPLYLLVTPLYFFLSLHLLRYARSIRQLEAGGGALSMEEALGHQKAFWRLVGIISAVTMSIYGLILLIGLVALVIIAALR